MTWRVPPLLFALFLTGCPLFATAFPTQSAVDHANKVPKLLVLSTDISDTDQEKNEATEENTSDLNDVPITIDVDDESIGKESDSIDTGEYHDHSLVTHEGEKDDEILFEIASSDSLPSIGHTQQLRAQEAADEETLLDQETLNDEGMNETPIEKISLTSQPIAVSEEKEPSAPAEESDDLWERIRLGFSMPDIHSPLVKQEERWYMKHHDTVIRIFERARPFLHYIVDQIQKNKMPTELALLPIVESAYNPFALSPAKASGLWQFIPSTGKKYKLSQNWWVDERRDIIASTKAALTYFSQLYEQFNDWQMALAAYNWGEAAVQNSIQRNEKHHLPTDYLHLRMPEETRHYLPRLQALKNIITDPQKYGLSLPYIRNKPYLVAVELSTTLDIPTAAKLAELPIDKFLHLNPGFNRPVIKSNENKEKTYVLLLPYDKKNLFFDNLDAYRRDHKQLTHWHLYYIYQRKSVNDVAQKFGVKSSQILLSNGLKKNTHWIHGRILIPDAKNPISAAIERQIHKYIGKYSQNYHKKSRTSKPHDTRYHHSVTSRHHLFFSRKHKQKT